jgi:hypothetical protein
MTPAANTTKEKSILRHDEPAVQPDGEERAKNFLKKTHEQKTFAATRRAKPITARGAPKKKTTTQKKGKHKKKPLLYLTQPPAGVTVW